MVDETSPVPRPPHAPPADGVPPPDGTGPLRGCGPAIGFTAGLLVLVSCAMVYEPELRHGLSRVRAVPDDATKTVAAASGLRQALDAPADAVVAA
ncbi:hypothetical protein [Euzebya pacifica]|nr:hypothetical protein [Euzebya pacifica]